MSVTMQDAAGRNRTVVEDSEISTNGTLYKYVSVGRCARCGENHTKLAFKEMKVPIQCGDEQMTHFATCPKTGDPILMVIRQTNN